MRADPATHSACLPPGRVSRLKLTGKTRFQALREHVVTFMDPQPSREYVTLAAGEELAAHAFIRAWTADDVDKGMLLIEQHHVLREAALFVMSLVKAARRALLSAEGYNVERAVAVLDQWMEDAGRRAAV